MQRTVVFPGAFIVNGKIDAESVGVYLSDGEASFTSETGNLMLRRRRLYVLPFSKFVLQPRDKRQLLEATQLCMSGTHVGALVDGPLGHPADIENTYLPVASVRVIVHYSKDGFGCLIEGATHEKAHPSGIDGESRPWSFKLRFEVALAQYSALFGLSSENFQRIQGLHVEAFGAC